VTPSYRWRFPGIDGGWLAGSVDSGGDDDEPTHVGWHLLA
jgi:hypothetical protein